MNSFHIWSKMLTAKCYFKVHMLIKPDNTWIHHEKDGKFTASLISNKTELYYPLWKFNKTHWQILQKFVQSGFKTLTASNTDNY